MSLFKEATFVTVRKKEVERIRDRIGTLGPREKAYSDSDGRTICCHERRSTCFICISHHNSFLSYLDHSHNYLQTRYTIYDYFFFLIGCSCD